MQTYIGYSKPRRKRHFTNLQVVLTVSMFDFDQLLLTSPLTAREDIMRAAQSLVDRYFTPSIAQTLTDVQPYQMYLPFMVWQSADSDLDLGLYYDQLRGDVDAGRVWITLGGTRYAVDNLYYQGSFYQICPRSCHQNLTQSVCNWLPNCGWSHQLAQCTTDALLPERHEMTVLVPCHILPYRTPLETDALIASFKHEVENVLFVYPNISSRNVHSFGIGQVYPSSLVFTVQRSMMSPPLLRMVEDLDKWIAAGGLMIDIGPNSTRVTAKALGNFTELEVALRYEAMNLTNTTNLTIRQLVAENLTRLIEDVFPLGVISVANFRLSQKYVRFDAEKTGDMSLREMEKLMQELWRLGGFGIVQGNVKHLPNEINFQEKFHSNCTLDCSTSLDAGHCNKLQMCVWFTEGNVSHCARDHKLPDRYQLDLFVPCMDLNAFSATEVNTIEQTLLQNFTTILGTPNSNVVTNVTITRTGVRVDLQASVQFPHLERYVTVLSNHTDYRTGFRFGVQPRFSIRNRLDYTNVHVKLTFYSIDFELLKIKYSYDDLTAKVVRSLNNVLLGVLVQSLEMVSIHREVVEFTVRKEGESNVHMEDEIKILTAIVEEGQFSLDIPFVRPVVASSIFVEGSFRQLCPDKYPVFTTTTVNVPVTISAANFTTSQPITTTLTWSRPSVILIYNHSEVQRSLLHSQMESYGVSACLVDIRQCPACMTRFSRNTCSFDDSNVTSLSTHAPIDTTPDHPSKLPMPDDGFHIGLVAATTMAVGGFFVLALLMWAAQSIHEAMKKENGNKPETENDPATISQAGRGIEELPEAD
ncbi:hypothetical protein KP79_PYT12005 [Mizuhopecten yessoensis]|uniref:Uncharacterized protein n=2 Tax=Mizuhopecten yessoensis TaxID=6573 RepID=A0A210R5S0_MIZYE|nr:hypothetical protein KP79_PYT12005 [Mizuhopecten yessoensis]